MGNLTDDERKAYRDALRAVMELQRLTAILGTNAPRRETVTDSFNRAAGRAQFFTTINRLAPHVAQDLIDSVTSLKSQWSDEGIESADKERLIEMIKQRIEDEDTAIAAWQHRHFLTDSWITHVARHTHATAEELKMRNIPLIWAYEDVEARADEGKVISDPPVRSGVLTARNRCEYVDIWVWLDDLKFPDEDCLDACGDYLGTIEDDGRIGAFNPRNETIDDAVRRLMPAIEKRLRYALGEIVREDRTMPGATKPVTFRKQTAFEWLVRYQVLGESKANIARTVARDRGKGDPDFYRSHVGREINRVAKLIGLTLRTP